MGTTAKKKSGAALEAAITRAIANLSREARSASGFGSKFYADTYMNGKIDGLKLARDIMRGKR